ncbi:MAG: single-stranded DNA-binding protein [Myxococcota bacterium]
MASMAKMTIIGNLGKDPEVRYTQSGVAVCNLNVAVNERRKEGDSWTEHTEWYTIVCFDKRAELAGEYLKKGRQVYAEGRPQYRTWQDRDGQTRVSAELVAFQLLFLGGRDSMGHTEEGVGSPTPATPKSSENPTPEGQPTPGGGTNFQASGEQLTDDDVPF